MKKLGEYDLEKLREAKNLIKKVYEYNYDSSSLSKRLYTVLNKLDEVIKAGGKKDG